MEYAFTTNIGRRLRNEDNYYIPREGDVTPLFMVADGMGGHAAGIRASTMAVEGLAALLGRKPLPEDVAKSVHDAIERVNLSIYRHAQANEGCRGMGTTLTLALIPENGTYIAANVGDSRLYHFNGQSLAQVTTDHSLVAVLVATGEITKAEAARHPQRNIITRALGTGAYEEIDLFSRGFQPGDMLLLCSDGLHGMLSDDKIAHMLSEDRPLQETCDALVDAALLCGGTDNVTVVIVRLEGGDGQ